MYPHERSLVKKLAGQPFVLLGMNSDASPEKLAKVVERENLTWPMFFDGGGTGGPIATKWGVRGWPSIFVMDAEGIIRERDCRDEEMERVVMKLLAELRRGR